MYLAQICCLCMYLELNSLPIAQTQVECFSFIAASSCTGSRQPSCLLILPGMAPRSLSAVRAETLRSGRRTTGCNSRYGTAPPPACSFVCSLGSYPLLTLLVPLAHYLQRIPGADDAALTCVAWCADASGIDRRILSAGLDGQIIEHDLDTLRPLHITDSHGGAIWGLVREPSQRTPGEHRFAVACDDGAVRLYVVDDSSPGARYSKSLPRIEGRVLSVAWHPNGKIVVAGDSTGCIRCWDVDTAR